MTNLVISGVIDGPLPGGQPKAIELTVLADIADLSIYGISSANNGGGTTGSPEVTLAGSASAGDKIYVAANEPDFLAFFGFAPDVTDGAANINGDDAIELFENGTVVDVFGETDVDGTGQPWEHLDGWAYRVDGTGPDGATFELANWTFSGPDALDNETGNDTAATPFPIGTFAATPAAAALVVVQSDGTSEVAEGGATDSFAVALDSQPDSEVTVTVTPDGQVTTDAAELAFTAANWDTPQSVTVTAVDDADIEGDHGATVNLTAASADADFDALETDVAVGITDNDAPLAPTLISAVQGSMASSPIVGALISIQGIVTATFLGDGEFGGFFVQEEDSDVDGDAATSEGIFVSAPGLGISLAEGYQVTVTGTVEESFGQTQLGGVGDADVTIDDMAPLATVSPAPIDLPVPTDQTLEEFYEPFEGMLVQFIDTLTVTQLFNYERFGEVHFSEDGRVYQYTQTEAPDEAGNAAYQDEQLARRIIVNDGSNDQNPDTIPFLDVPEFGAGDTVTDLTGVLSYGFGSYRVEPTEGAPIVIDNTNPREAAPADVGGSLKVASFNVLNYFVTLDTPENAGAVNGQDPRGAHSPEELERQAGKIVAALDAMDADVVGLIEIENDAGAAVQDLVTRLNAVSDRVYDFVDTGVIGTDAIKVAFIYDTQTVAIAEGSAPAILDSDDFVGPMSTVLDPNDILDFDPKNRAALAVTFEELATGEQFTAVNNHFKSKGSGVQGEDFDELSGDDLGTIDGQQPVIGVDDGQGSGSATRESAADQLADWLATNPTGSDDADIVILGDLNAYAAETAIGELLEGADDTTGTDDDFVDLAQQGIGADAYSFRFSGQWGTLDYALANTALASQVTGVTVWHANSDEPAYLDYNDAVRDANEASFQAKPAALNDAVDPSSPFQSSDHDPIIVGLDLGADTQLELQVNSIARFTTGSFDESAAEIVAHENGRLFVTNAEAGTVSVYDIATDDLIGSIDVGEGGPNSVAVRDGIVAVAVEATDKTDNGFIKLYDADTLAQLASLDAGGALPDMLTFSKDGTRIFAAIEGEPNDDYSIDPVGGVAIVDLNPGDLAASVVTFAGFEAFDGQEDALRADGVRIFGPGASASQDLEPEYVAEGDGVLYVGLQENNALGILDLATNQFTDIVTLGFKDHSVEGNGFDGSDRDGAINIATYPIFGMYQPDTIATYEVDGETYIVTVNEGDAREYDTFEEEADVEDIVLDPTAFPDAAALQSDEQLGRLNITTTLGDTDNDGDFDALYTFGGRSFSIWDASGTLVFDSGDQIEQIIAAEFPDLFNVDNDDPFDVDSRSDNKGPEPEALAIAEIEDRFVALVGLERQNAIMFFDITDPVAPTYLQTLSTVDPADEAIGEPYPNSDLGPESIAVITAEDSLSGELEIVVANEVSGSVSMYTVENLFGQPQPAFTLELLHVADQEAGSGAVVDAPNLSAVMNALEAQDLGDDGIADNTIRLSSGDAFIPGLFYDASAEVFGSGGIADIQIQNELMLQAVTLGNHEFDFGTAELAGLISGDAAGDFSSLVGSTLDGQDFAGAAFPYLSTNLDFSTDANLAPLAVAGGQAPIPNAVTSSTVIEEGGELIGVVGATTPTLDIISSPGDVGILPEDFDANPTPEQLDALAAIIQAEVDALLADNPEMNKVILLAHMQQIEIEFGLAARLTDVDIIVAGGSNTRLFDDNDRARDGDSDQGQYPAFIENAGGTTTAVVNTDGSYKYVGRLVIDFDADGNIIADSYDADVSGAYATDAQGVADLGAEGLVDPEIQAIADAIEAEIVATEGNVFGVSDVFLNGNRSGTFAPTDPDGVRSQETNLGNLTADANLAAARAVDDTVMVSIKNGGGIRANIGETIVPPGGSEAVRSPNEEVRDGDGNLIKPAGGISQNDIATTLAFNNNLTLLTLTKAELLDVLEHGVGAIDSANEEGVAGRFPQIAGVQFSFDETLPEGDRIVNAVIADENGDDLMVLKRDGAIEGDPAETVRIVTLGFLAGGGDGYPFPQGDAANRVDLDDLDGDGVDDGAATGAATFAFDGTEQDALAEFLAATFADPASAYDAEDTGPVGDTRIQNLLYRSDDVIDAFTPDVVLGDGEAFVGNDGGQSIRSGAGANQITLGTGENAVSGTLADLFGDLIENFDLDDAVGILGQVVPRSSFQIEAGSVIVGIDEDNDGVIDGSFTLDGVEVEDGTVMAVADDDDTVITFETFLPQLAEATRVDAGLINGINNQPFLDGADERGFRVTLQEDVSAAGFDNALGVYEITGSGEIVDIRMLVDNANATPSASIDLTDVEAGHTLGFFLVQDGADFATGLAGSDTLEFIDTGSGDALNAFAFDGVALHRNGADTGEIVFHSFDAGLNPDDDTHALSGVSENGESIFVGFEDLLNTGDADYQDVVFRVDTFDLALA